MALQVARVVGMKYRFKPGDHTYFQPVISRIDGRTGSSDDTAIPVLVEAVRHEEGKVFYDISLPNGEGGYYRQHPLRSVDSYFIVRHAEEVGA